MSDDTNSGKAPEVPSTSSPSQTTTTTTSPPVFDPSKYTDSTGVRSSNREIETKERGGG